MNRLVAIFLWHSLTAFVVVFQGPVVQGECTTGLISQVRNSFQSSTSAALRISADTGNSFGARGMDRSLRPASCDRRRDDQAVRTKSEMTAGTLVSKPTTSSIPRPFGSAMVKPLEVSDQIHLLSD